MYRLLFIIQTDIYFIISLLCYHSAVYRCLTVLFYLFLSFLMFGNVFQLSQLNYVVLRFNDNKVSVYQTRREIQGKITKTKLQNRTETVLCITLISMSERTLADGAQRKEGKRQRNVKSFKSYS